MKKRRHKLFHLLFWLFVIAGGLWVAFAPASRHEGPSVQVEVEHPTAAPENSTAPTGDEKAEVSVKVAPPKTESTPAPSGPPKIAIVIDDVGLDIKDSARATELPAAVTLSFMPYAEQLRAQTKAARDAGHELMLHMPMEPMGHDNPGPGALLVDLPPEEIRQRFETALASFTGFDGVNNHMGSKFTAYAPGMEIVIDELQQRGLFFLDSRTSAQTVGESIARQHGLPTIRRDVFLDDTITPDAIRAQLDVTESLARKKGYAVAIGHPHPATLDVLEQWIPEAQKRGIVFVKLNDLITKQ